MASKRRILFLLRALGSLALLLAVGFSVAIAADEPTQGGTLTIALQATPTTIDWMTNNATSARVVPIHIYEGLATFDGSLDPVPQLAESWEANEDNTVWTFKLRQGITFHDGGALTAEDVVASYERFLLVSPRSADFTGVESVTALDDYTIQFTCSSPSRIPTLLALYAPQAYVMPARYRDVGIGELAVEDLIGTGPFKLVEWIPDKHIKLARFDEYVPSDFPASGFAGKRIAYVDEVVFKCVTETGARVAGLETGEYDIIEALPIEDVNRFDQDASIVVGKLSLPYLWVSAIMNTTKWPFSDLRMRQAVLAALCQDEIMSVVGHGRPEFYNVDPSIFMTPSKWYSDIGDRLGLYNQCDTEKAKRLMEEAGYDGEPIVIVTNHAYDSMYRASMMTAAQLEKIGFAVELEVYDWPGARTRRGDLTAWDICYTGHTPRQDPSLYYGIYYGPNEWCGWQNDIFDRLIEEDMQTFDDAERYRIWEEIQAEFYRSVGPEIKHGDIYALHAWQSYVQGYAPAFFATAWNVWLDK